MSAQGINEAEAVDPRRSLLIVVGAHLEAELADRPLGYRLRDDVLRWQHRTPEADPLLPVVCTDLWYLNAAELMVRPTIAVGETSGLSSSPGGVSHTFGWNSVADLGVANVSGVIFRITPSDTDTGTPDSVTIDVDNSNDQPIVFIGSPAAGDLRSGNVDIEYVLIDGNSDSIDITVEYSTDGVTYLAYGTREPDDIAYYPRSNKVYFRGVGLMTRLEHLDYDDGEPADY